MAKKKEEVPTEQQGAPTLIEWVIPDTVITRFASNMVVQIVEGCFKLSFFEIKPEIILPPPKTPPTKIAAECVGSVVVTPQKLEAIVKVLSDQLERHNQATQAKAEVDHKSIN